MRVNPQSKCRIEFLTAICFLSYSTNALCQNTSPPKEAKEFYARAIEAEKKDAFNRDYKRIIADYKQVITLDPKHHAAYNALAWNLATCDYDAFRDGKAAVEHAKKACELTSFKDWRYLDTLAAAYAEAGDFENAVKLQRAALLDPDFPEGQDFYWEEAALEPANRLLLFENKTPYRNRGFRSGEDQVKRLPFNATSLSALKRLTRASKLRAEGEHNAAFEEETLAVRTYFLDRGSEINTYFLALSSRGVFHVSERRFKEGIADLTRFINDKRLLRPEDPRLLAMCHWHRGVAYLRTSQFEKALSDADEVSRLDASFKQDCKNLKTLIERRKRGGAPTDAEITLLAKLITIAVANSLAKDQDHNGGTVAALFSVGARAGRDGMIESALKDLFPDLREVEIRGIRRVTSQCLDGKLSVGNFSKQTAKEEIIEELQRQDPALGRIAGVADFVYEVHQAKSAKPNSKSGN